MSELVAAVAAQPRLYWHPLVRRQLTYLKLLCSNTDEWCLRYESSLAHGALLTAKVLEVAEQTIKDVMEAHVTGLLPGTQLQWERERAKPGPRTGFNNPHPTVDPESESVDFETVTEDYESLRDFFSRDLNMARLFFSSEEKIKLHKLPGESAEDADARIERLARTALDATGTGSWSGWRDRRNARPEHAPNESWDVYEDQLEAWERSEEWRPLAITDAIRDMRANRMDRRFKKEGKPAYLACVILGALLQQEPKKVFQAIDNFKHPRRRKPQRGDTLT